MDPYPHAFEDGADPPQVASGDQVMENFEHARSAVDVLETLVDAGWRADDLQASLAELVGVSADGIVRRGKFVQAVAGTRTNAAYGPLSNGPDEVARVVLPADGLLCVSYRALVKESVWGAARVALFVNGAQLVLSTGANSVPAAVQEAPIGATSGSTGPNVAGVYRRLVTEATGLAIAGDGFAGDATFGALTAPLLTSYLVCEMAAGTYSVGVQYKASSGTVTAQDRTLRAFALAFG